MKDESLIYIVVKVTAEGWDYRNCLVFNSSSHILVNESLISWTEVSDTYRIIYLLALVSVINCVVLTELHLQQCVNSGLMVHWI